MGIWKQIKNSVFCDCYCLFIQIYKGHCWNIVIYMSICTPHFILLGIKRVDRDWHGFFRNGSPNQILDQKQVLWIFGTFCLLLELKNSVIKTFFPSSNYFSVERKYLKLRWHKIEASINNYVFMLILKMLTGKTMTWHSLVPSYSRWKFTIF